VHGHQHERVSGRFDLLLPRERRGVELLSRAHPSEHRGVDPGKLIERTLQCTCMLQLDKKQKQKKYNINLDFLPIHRCVLALCSQYFPESCEKTSQACYSDGIRTHDPCNLMGMIKRTIGYEASCRVSQNS
jgi:hypothetical protein